MQLTQLSDHTQTDHESDSVDHVRITVLEEPPLHTHTLTDNESTTATVTVTVANYQTLSNSIASSSETSVFSSSIAGLPSDSDDSVGHLTLQNSSE
jgi:hypothetical protein